MKKSLRNLLIFLGIAVLLMVGYFVFFQNKGVSTNQTTSTLSSTARTSATAPLAASGSATGSQLLALLGRVSTLTLNDDIFANPAFAMLQDISIVLPQVDAQGRRNPFAPISVTNTAATGAVTQNSGASTTTVTNPQ
jgi:hypothetical protein